MTSTPTDDLGGPGPTPDPADDPAGDQAGKQGGPRVSAEEVRDLGRLRRSGTDRKIAGVAGGLARHLDVDPTVIRVALVVLALFGGAGVILYGALWLLVPEDGEPDATIHLDPKTRTVALWVVGIVALAALLGNSWHGWGFPWPAVIIGGIVLLVLGNRQGRRDREQTRVPAPPGATAYGDPAYGDPAYGQAAYPQPTYAAAPPRPSRRERRRALGPSLFLPTLATIAVSLGLLRLWELDGHHVADGAYAALALAICGGALVVGAWTGRAGAVLWIALFSGLALAGSTAADDIGKTVERPSTAAEVQSSYDLGIGQLVLDLTDVTDPAALDGRTINLDGTIGDIEVIVPDDIDVHAVADISGGGDMTVFGERDNRDNPHLDLNHVAGDRSVGDVPRLTILADLNFGQITIKDQPR